MPIYWGAASPWWFAWVAVGAYMALSYAAQNVDPAIVAQANNPGNF